MTSDQAGWHRQFTAFSLRLRLRFGAASCPICGCRNHPSNHDPPSFDEVLAEVADLVDLGVNVDLVERVDAMLRAEQLLSDLFSQVGGPKGVNDRRTPGKNERRERVVIDDRDPYSSATSRAGALAGPDQ
jgi:hypothetical protein